MQKPLTTGVYKSTDGQSELQILTRLHWLSMRGPAEHPVDWSNVAIMSNPPDYTSRIIQEAIYIRTTKNTLNRDNGALPTEYENLIRTQK